MKRFAGLSEQPTSWCIYSPNCGQSCRGTEDDDMKQDENRFLFHSGDSATSSEREDLQGANEDTSMYVCGCFLPCRFHKAFNLSLTCYFSPSLQNLKIAASLLNNLLHFSLQQKKGGVINQNRRTCDVSGTKGELAEFASDAVIR